MKLQNCLSGAFTQMLGLTLFLTCFAALNSIFAQNIRLRAHLNPSPAGSSNAKYADLTADGNLAVMGSYTTRGAFIMDISNPDAPILKAHYNPAPQQQFLEAVIVGNRAYFGSGIGNDGVHIVDLSDPSNPVLLGKVNSTTVPGTFNSIHEIVVDGNYLYENLNGLNSNLIKVIDVSNPAAPRFVRNIVPQEVRWIHAVHIRNGRMYTSGWGNASTPGLTEIIDVSNIEVAAPLLGSVASGNNTHSSWTSEDGNYLYVCREFFDGDLRVYDIRNISQPLLVKVIKAADLNINAICPHNPMVKGNRLYVGWYQAGVQVFDISDPADPKRVGQFDTYTPAFAESEARAEASNLGLEPWDMICGTERMANLPTNYDGNWTAFPLLGHDKVLLADLATGLYVVDATAQISTSGSARNRNADFDGDGRTDFSIFTRSNGVWSIENSSNSAASLTNFGLATDQIRPGDYDGDGKTDIAVFRPAEGTWYIVNSRDNSFRAFYFGSPGDVPVSADYDSDGEIDAAVFRNGVWYVLRSTMGFYAGQWGRQGDEPITGDFDGDGKSDLAVTRNQNGQKIWYIFPSSSSIPQYATFGLSTDKTVVADFDGDQRTDIAVYRPSESNWYILNSRTNAVGVAQFGIASDMPIPADYDGDARADIAVYRAETNVWYGLRSRDNSVFARQFGGENAVPAPAAAQPGN